MIYNEKIYIHDIYYLITLIVIKKKEVNEAYNMLLDYPWLIDVKINQNWNNNLVTIYGNKTIKIVLISQKKRLEPKLSEILVCYNFVVGFIDEEEEFC